MSEQKPIKIYLTQTCPFCSRALALLQQKQLQFEVIDVAIEPGKREEMQKLSQRTSVPQIFIDSKSIGGCDDIYALDASGELDELLFGS